MNNYNRKFAKILARSINLVRSAIPPQIANKQRSIIRKIIRQHNVDTKDQNLKRSGRVDSILSFSSFSCVVAHPLSFLRRAIMASTQISKKRKVSTSLN